MTDRELMQQVLEDICGAKLCEINSMSSRVEMIRLLDSATTALRERLAQPEQEPVAWVYPEGLEAFKNGKPWTAYGSNGDGRIPLYLNDAVAPRVEPPAAESGAGFESLPASPNQPEKNHG